MHSGACVSHIHNSMSTRSARHPAASSGHCNQGTTLTPRKGRDGGNQPPDVQGGDRQDLAPEKGRFVRLAKPRIQKDNAVSQRIRKAPFRWGPEAERSRLARAPYSVHDPSRKYYRGHVGRGSMAAQVACWIERQKARGWRSKMKML